MALRFLKARFLKAPFPRKPLPRGPFPQATMTCRAFSNATLTWPVLDYLAVRPEYRGQGIGSRLVEKGLTEAEKAGLDTCVLALRAGLGVYTGAGFTLLDQVVQDASPWGGEKENAAYFL